MKKNKFFILLAIATALTACNQKLGESDPLANQPDYVKEAKPPGRVGEKPCAALQPNEMLIDSSADLLNFQETVTATFNFSARVLRPNSTSKISILNMDQFPGASFDAATGDFKWTPPRGFVGKESVKNLTVNVMISAQLSSGKDKCDNTIYVNNRSFAVLVQRVEGVPSITRVEDLDKGTFREGGRKSLKVYVKDLDALPEQPPSLAILPSSRGSSVAAFMSLGSRVPVQSKSDPTIWEFEVDIDLGTAELTQSYDDFGYRLIAYSRFGRASATHEASIKIYTNLMDPVVTAKDVTFEASKDNNLTFFVMDIKEEGRISHINPNINLLPGIKSFKCANEEAYQLVCAFDYKPDLAAINKKYNIEMSYTSRTQVPGDNLSISKKVKFTVSVVAPKATPVPKPTPNPMGSETSEVQ